MTKNTASLHHLPLGSRQIEKNATDAEYKRLRENETAPVGPQYVPPRGLDRSSTSW